MGRFRVPKSGAVHKKLQAMARWKSAFDSEFDNRGCISPNSDNGLIPANEMKHFKTAATGNKLTGADEQEAGRYEAGRVNGIAAEAADISRLVGSAGRLGGLGGPGRLA